jgi:DNA-directed RNA polymerase specialized sigma24 family protein
MLAAPATTDRNRLALSTAELVAEARRGEPTAWAEVVARYEGMVRGVVSCYRLQDADAADAMQMTWLRAFERLDRLRDPERLGGWLATIAGRECLALLRRARWRPPARRWPLTWSRARRRPCSSRRSGARCGRPWPA